MDKILRPTVHPSQMLHHLVESDLGRAGEDGTVTDSEVTHSLVQLSVSPGEAHSTSVRLVLAGCGHLGRQPLCCQRSNITEGGPAQRTHPRVGVATGTSQMSIVTLENILNSQ